MDRQQFEALEEGDVVKYDEIIYLEGPITWAERYSESPGVKKTHSIVFAGGARVKIDDREVADLQLVKKGKSHEISSHDQP